MIPSILSSQVQKGIEDFLKTTFPVSTPFFHGIMDRFLEKEGGIFRGPYLSIKLPYRTASISKDFFPGIPLPFNPYHHQGIAFKRLSGERPASTIIATGTGSGKTECFLYPILDHCRRHRGEPGIKAIIIYPMNALATDQAKRVARLIYDNPNLNNHIKAGLYIGPQEEHASPVMDREQLITDRHTMRLSPPDILLTNYKMLDYLLIRPRDFALWKENSPETLKYLVVDEIHTFDGAQGTDLACLIRRLKSRLRLEAGQLCCIGTSATLGEKEIPKVCSYAAKVFGERFDTEAVVTESLVTAEEFLTDGQIERNNVIPPQRVETLNPEAYENDQAYLKAQYEMWFGEPVGNENDTWPLLVPERLRKHGFFWKLILSLNNRIVPLDDLIQLFNRFIPEFVDAPVEYKRLVMESIIALISAARIKKEHGLAPFLSVRLQFWLRELRRIVGNIDHSPSLHFSDDLRDEEQRHHLPVIHCRECGAMGWGGTKREQDQQINPDLQHFYTAFFRNSPAVVVLFPDAAKTEEGGQEEFGWIFCGECLHVAMGKYVKEACPACGKQDKLIPVFMPNMRRKKERGVEGSHDCPYCQGYNSLTILGSRAASLTSVVISQLYASTFNKDKKLLTFSDSVQDAAHRAGFFAARTYRFNLRGALQKFLNEQTAEPCLTEVPAGFIQYWRERMTEEVFVTTFLPPDMAWLTDYEILVDAGALPEGSKLGEDLEKRLDWEIVSEYGFNSRIGRTLEKTGSSVAYVDRTQLQEPVERIHESLRNEIGLLRNLEPTAVSRFLAGLLIQLKTKGALLHEALHSYIENWGGYYLINRIPWMPKFGKFSRTPVFLTSKRGTRFDPLLSSDRSRSTWYEDWLRRCFSEIHSQVSDYRQQIFTLVVQELLKKGILEERQVQGFRVWGINSGCLCVTNKVVQFRCRICSHNVSVAKEEATLWEGNACLRFSCRGRYVREAPSWDFYGHLYATGEVQRIFTAEHTGLLTREKREKIEKRFMLKKPPPGSPNLISCTPTLELGIDIGDLSSVILCSVPPAQSNYVQRVGRSGRENGNSFNLTVANGRPHDLYFYTEPEAMIAGSVEPPGCFLDAPAVLERQMTAFCFDRWIESGISVMAVPDHLGQVLSQLEDRSNRKKFPHNFIQYIELHRSTILKDFMAMFQDSLTERSGDYLKRFAYGTNENEQSLTYRIIDRLTSIHKERANLRKRVQKLTQLIREKESNAIKDQNYESQMDELLREKAALNSIIRKITEKETYNFFTDESLLPNYAFPEAGIILQSIIYKKKSIPDKGGKYLTNIYEYERPAVSAIHELAPDNHFYAEGRKVQVDQVNLNLSEIEEWRFCNACSHMEMAVTGDTTAACPACGSVLWRDDGQKKRMIRMRQVIATTPDRESRIQDDSDEREPEFFHKQVLLQMDEHSVEVAFKISDDNFPFGMEFVQKVTFREMNFGKRDNIGESIMIAGKEFPKNGFAVCRGCGKVQGDKKPSHTLSCSKKDGDQEKNILDFLYIYREFNSQALRILLPAQQLSWTDKKLHSFTAALYLGLKKKFEGNIDHIRTTIHEEPSQDHQYRKRYLVLYDMVPGGTGYLKELMENEQALMDVFQMALEILTSCRCHQDTEKDGCYRCLYAYRNNYDRNYTSRDTAIELLSEILRYRDQVVRTSSLKNLSVNPLLDSALEERFIEALRSFGTQDIKVAIRQEIVNGKPGWYLKVNDLGYFIEPRVDLGLADGIMVPSRADFTFYPERSAGGRAIVVFTDGFMFHAKKGENNRVGKDIAQRMAIARSNKFTVWSLSWDDVENSLEKKGGHYENFLGDGTERINHLYESYDDQFQVKKLGGLRYQSSFNIFMAYLAQPVPNMWKMCALIHGMAHLECACQSDDARSAAQALWQDIPWHDVQLETKSDQEGRCLIGLYQKSTDDGPLIKLFASLDKEDYARNQLHKMSVVCRFFDDDELADKPHYKAAWNGFIRMYNIYQFIPKSIFITSKGVSSGQYLWLMTEEEKEKDKTSLDSVTWAELRKVTDLNIHPFLSFLFDHGLPLPEPGFELCNENNEIIATGELCWPEKKIALLRDDEVDGESCFIERGWHTMPLADVISDPSRCLSLFK